jgi:hypothetical protein
VEPNLAGGGRESPVAIDSGCGDCVAARVGPQKESRAGAVLAQDGGECEVLLVFSLLTMAHEWTPCAQEFSDSFETGIVGGDTTVRV